MKTLIKRSWSRTHSGLTDYLTIQEKIYTITMNVVTDINRKEVVSKDYEIETIKLLKEENIWDKDHFVAQCMEKSNIATNNYKYFLVILGDKTSIICQDYKEFCERLQDIEIKRSKLTI